MTGVGSMPLVSEFEREQASARRRRTARQVIWVIALLFIIVPSISTWFNLQLHVTTAPQQAGEAAEGLFYAIVPYVIARGLDAMLR